MPPLSLFLLLVLPQPTTSLHQNSYKNHTFTLPLSTHSLTRLLTHSPPTPGQLNNIAAHPNVDDDHRLPATVVMMRIKGRLVQEKASQPSYQEKGSKAPPWGLQTRKPKQKRNLLAQPTSPPNQIRPVGCLVSSSSHRKETTRSRLTTASKSHSSNEPSLSSCQNRPPTQHPAAFNIDEHPSLSFPHSHREITSQTSQEDRGSSS